MKEPRLRPFRVDLHVHSVLSPCGELEMGAGDIAARAREIGLDGLALTDHNASANVPALRCACAGGPVVIPGAEVQTEEDIHVVALFREDPEALAFQGWLWDRLPGFPNDPEVFGYQLVVDAEGQILDQVDPLLVLGVAAGVDEVLREIRDRGGISILAHVDRPSFSYTSVLGPVPPDVGADAIELSWRVGEEEAARWRARLPHLPFLRSSDAHRLGDMRADRTSLLLLESLCFDELRLALRGEEGRRVLEPWPFP